MDIAQFNLAKAEHVADPHLLPALAALRAAEPVYWSEAMKGWILTRHADVSAAFKDRRILNDRVPAFSFTAIPREDWPRLIPNLWRGVNSWLVNMDAPRHSRLRAMLMKAFTPKFVESLRPRIEQLTVEAVDKAARLGSFDFMREIAYPIPARIIMGIVGLDEKNLDKLRTIHARTTLTVQTRASRETLLEGEAAMAEFNAMVQEEIDRRRVQPKNDFLSALVAATDEEGRLNDEELLAMCQLLLFAGQDTTMNSLCFGLKAFQQFPDQRDLFLSGEVDPIAAMAEVTRYTAMSTCMFKLAGEDFDVGGKTIRAGDIVYIMIAAANHDPEVFPDPGVMDFRRPNLSQVMSFAPGIHMCLGHHLAKLEMAIFFKHFLTRFPYYRITDDPVRYHGKMAFRGMDGLNVTVE